MNSLELSVLVERFSAAFCSVDARRPVYTSRSGREYQPGLGPHAEDAAMRLVVDELTRTGALSGLESGQFEPYPNTPRQKADLWIGRPLQWVVEVKMARFFGDNGKPDDTAIKDILSPYPRDRSALADCSKLARSGFDCGKAVLIYGFDYPDRPLDLVIEAFELLATRSVGLGARHSSTLPGLVHPVHASGRVFAWSVGTPRNPASQE